MLTVKQAEKIVKSFAAMKILVVGDLMLDRYVTGTVTRISPEAPVPVLRVTGERALPGGAANVALNIQSLGGQAVVAGVVGRDRAGQELLAILSDRGIGVDGVLATKRVQTTVKTRVIAERQQIVRVDREDEIEPDADVLRDLCKRISSLASSVDGIIIEDYGKGVVTQGVVDSVLACAKQGGKLVGYDPKENAGLRLTDITLATPNYKEACCVAGIKESAMRAPPESDPVLRTAAETLVKIWKPELLIITLGPHGMYLVSRGGEPRVIPTRAREVYDVCGAGDTVIAAAMLALAGGASHEDAAAVANCAAGVVVGKVGTATCSPQELLSYAG